MPTRSSAATAPSHASQAAELDSVIRTIVRQLRNPALAQRVGDQAKQRLEPSLYALLSRIGDQQPVRAADLAAGLGVTPSTVSRQVAALEDRGLVKRTVDPADGRALMLRLTPAGTRTRQKMQDAWVQVLESMMTDWKPADVDSFVASLHRFHDALAAFAKG